MAQEQVSSDWSLFFFGGGSALYKLPMFIDLLRSSISSKNGMMCLVFFFGRAKEPMTLQHIAWQAVPVAFIVFGKRIDPPECYQKQRQSGTFVGSSLETTPNLFCWVVRDCQILASRTA